MEGWTGGGAIDEKPEVVPENPELISRSLTQLKALITQTYPNVDMKGVCARRDGDEFLLRFLRARKFDVKRAAELVSKFSEWSLENHITGTDLTPLPLDDELTAILKLGIWQFPGPNVRDQHGRQIVYMFPRNTQPWNFEASKVIRAFYFVMNRVLQHEHAQQYGLCMVNCASGVERKNFDRNLIKLLTGGIQERMPIRLGRMLACHAPAIINFIWPLVKVFLSEKMKSRVKFISNDAELQKYVPKQNLVQELGGTLVIDYQSWLQSELGATEEVESF